MSLPCPHSGCAFARTIGETLTAYPPGTVGQCPPGTANAKLNTVRGGPAINRRDLPEAVTNTIEDSLASAPSERLLVMVKDKTTEVETSQGLMTVKIETDVDDAADEIKRGEKTKQNKATKKDKVVAVPEAVPLQAERAPVAPATTETKVPRYLKTVPAPAIPSSNPAAPYGYDENDRPIGVPTSLGLGLAAPVKCECKLDTCSRCNPGPINRPNVHVKEAEDRKFANQTFIERPVVSESEAELRKQWGIDVDVKEIFKPSKRHYEFVDYAALFGLSRQDLVAYLDVIVDEEVIEDVCDFTQSKIRTLKSSGPLQSEITSAENQITAAKDRIAEIKDEIAASEKMINGWSVRVMRAEVALGKRQPDDVLDKSTRETFKREERQKISKLENERSGLREQIRTNEERLPELRERLANWKDDPANYDEEYPRTTRHYPIRLRDKFRVPPKEEFKGTLPLGHEYGLAGYAQLVHEWGNGVDSLFKFWRQLENEIVLNCIGWSLIRPSKALCKKHPTLMAYMHPDAFKDEKDSDNESHNDHEEERIYILKTGGASIGGQVYGGARSRSGRRQGLWSFDAPIGRPKLEEPQQGETKEPWVPKIDDIESFQPD